MGYAKQQSSTVISDLAQTYVDQIHIDGYAILKQAISRETVGELLHFATRFQHSDEEQAFLLGNQQFVLDQKTQTLMGRDLASASSSILIKASRS